MFSVDWFSGNIPLWKRHLGRFVGKPCKALEVGSYEGMSAVWLLENVLTHKDSSIVCVDNFSQKVPQTKSPVRKTFLKNMAPFKGRFTLLEGDSSLMLKTKKAMSTLYDIVYIDADHHSRHVMEDAVLVWSLLAPGGVLIFDDNTDNKHHDSSCPKPAIAAFLAAYAHELKVLHSGWQVIVQKRVKPLPIQRCHSEFYAS